MPRTGAAQPNLDWDQRQRLMLLEALLIWSGRVRPEDLGQALAVPAAEAGRLIEDYRTRYPDALAGDAHGGWSASERFEPAYLRGTVQEFLQVLRNVGDVAATPLSVVADRVAPIELLAPPERAFDIRVLQRLTAAIREARWLSIDYQSMSHPQTRRLRIAPHALAHAGRWHVRAWSETHGAWRDFLLGRVRGIPQLDERSAVDPERDWEWRHLVSVRVGPHPGLSADQQRVVELDYGMRHGLIDKTLRLALVPYYLRMLGVGGDDHLRVPAQQQIVLLNGDELASYDRLGPSAS